jgi:hypothetical protein
LKVTIIEGPFVKKARRNANNLLTNIVKREIERLGEAELRKVVSK